MAPKLALLIPEKLALLPGIQYLPWRTPFRLLPQAAQLIVVEKISNVIFKQQLFDGELCFLENTVLRIQIRDLAYDWQVSLKQDRLSFSPGRDSADTTFSGNSRDFLLLASRREDPDTLFFQRRLSIEGNTELGLHVKNLIDSVDMDELPAAFNHALNLMADFVEALPH
ncbi:ubiquinone anaerobic biosynthesis accessory factor UbiT [Methylophaga sp. OBS4]|uniref:ubiquinone anaerobic biosynthesis accessory factor UbiT n=1 Tax=Methylophaga sp. OBS4 TaxID=2991935 RepID=UPI0022516F37|nr:SCP2 sterol-binding domain-containing protein [Methylophaga sp. OBS4]MCX4187923.1 SCP2 sterol-binding domain-containing protein [Methylophaga sp. OBS4]